jgi:hypothetical protein
MRGVLAGCRPADDQEYKENREAHAFFHGLPDLIFLLQQSEIRDPRSEISSIRS